jgi:hypothetical protein
MAEFYRLAPEVAGGWGEKTEFSNKAAVQQGLDQVYKVVHLHYRFDGWMGDDIVAFNSTFATTERLASAIQRSGLTGAVFEEMDVSTSDMWHQYMNHVTLPRFLRLVPQGSVELTMNAEVISWSGHEVSFALVKDWQKPVTVRETLTALPPFALVVTGKFLPILDTFSTSECLVTPLKSLVPK